MKKAYFQYYETFEVILEKIKDTHQRGELREAKKTDTRGNSRLL